MSKAIRKEQDRKDKNGVLLVTKDIFDGNSSSSLIDDALHAKLTHS
jgi:hypothetical protein